MSKKSLFTFAVVVAVLGLSGYWLNTTGNLDVPRIFDVPSALGGSEAGGGEKLGEQSGDERPEGAFSQREAEGEAGHGEEGARPEGGGDRDREGGGFSVRTVLDVASDMWFLAVTIAVVVYLMRGLALVKAQLRRARRSAASPS
ncbi:hypothetical protein [Aggregatilinea lenta]|uniref:hypothetical protein n=1 Tax=Aggregatilinea lenta TaxID=913108 RepID=UPI000E5A5DC5|nr:hypothetical protein [Aggregatilinea lenta]